MNNNSVLTHNFGNSIIQQRESDGYINATAMCQATGRKWSHYFPLDSTKSFLNELSSDAGIPASLLIDCKKGNSAAYQQGTWVHPYIAINLAQWCSAAFAVQVSKWVIDWFKTAQNPISQPQPASQNDEIKRLELALALADRHGVEYATLALRGPQLEPPLESVSPAKGKPQKPRKVRLLDRSGQIAYHIFRSYKNNPDLCPVELHQEICQLLAVAHLPSVETIQRNIDNLRNDNFGRRQKP